MQVTIPNDVYSQLEHYARSVNQPLETVVAERLRASFCYASINHFTRYQLTNKLN